MTSESLGHFKVIFEDGVFANSYIVSSLVSFLGLSDVKDCFHRLRVPMWLSRYFAWEPVPAKVVGLESFMVDGIKVRPRDPSWPCAGSLGQRACYQIMKLVGCEATSRSGGD